ncbi:S66 peptidase family protein [uncultured Draconibacterium sp.]|uniref:S66 family peptidase n=1 Tax=uncultured Draconibacterium sp. TaxID=1573823 RepID=UPI003217583F
MIKPKRLQKGDKVAAVSLSSGLVGEVPYRYEIGKRQILETFGIEVVEMRNTLKNIQWIYENPEARAEDLMQAFEDKSIKGIFSTIGGEDSIRILPFIDFDIIKNNPKVFLGYSDSTITHFICNNAGLTSFYGPSILANLSENQGILRYTASYMKKALFGSTPIGIIEPAKKWTDEYLDWFNPENQKIKRVLRKPFGRKLLQGKGKIKGHLLGGCVQVLHMIIGTELWFSLDRWDGAILFLEISESELPERFFKYFLRNLAASKILEKINAIIFARPGGQRNDEELVMYDKILLDIISNEYGLSTLPILAQMDFGHTDPVFTIPYGVMAELDCDNQSFSIIEAGVV